MADSEFEEFRQYFDKLPQYIKANPNCYTLIPNMDLLDESPTESDCGDHRTGSIGQGDEDDSGVSGATTSLEPIREPFSDDLQLWTEKESPVPIRKRRKLPEIPKHSKTQWKSGSKEVSLAQELLDADLSGSTRHAPASTQSEKSSSANSGFGHRPIFVLKFSSSARTEDDGSPGSDQYPSLDSGNSTIHSDDGSSKPYSPHVGSINESFSPSTPSSSGVPFTQLELLEATHRGLHKFIPRHHDELELEVGDPIYMQKEADDLWCEGVNLRSGMMGIFPSAYVVDVDYDDFDPSAPQVKKERYLTNYIGSIETLYHKGNEVLCQAVKKITGVETYVATHKRPCILEISDQGIRMVDKGKVPANSTPCHDYFYSLKNISFCGFHPNDHRYFGFVTKHPTLNRFACHVFISVDSTRPVAEAVGRAFHRFYNKFLETAYPIEDIYLE